MPDWIRTQYDQVHSLFAQLTDISGGLDIPPGTSVQFTGVNSLQPWPTAPGQVVPTLPPIGGLAQVVRPGATPDDPNRGFVRYDLSTSDMANAGLFRCQWVLTPPNSVQQQSFPEDGYMTLLILSRA